MKRNTDIVLVGGGHTHALVLQALRHRPEPGAAVTLIAAEHLAPYSGMLPGFVAGHYSARELHIDLPSLCKAAGARLIHGRAMALDRAARRVLVAGNDPVGYDLLSIGVGITPALGAIAGAAERAVAVKPVSTFAARWEAFEADALRSGGARKITIVGGGAAGVELALAVQHKLRRARRPTENSAAAFEVTLATGGRLLASFPAAAAAHARTALARNGVTVLEGEDIRAIEPGAITLTGGRKVAADAVLLATNAAAPGWFASTGLPLTDDGFIAVRPTLQVLDDERIFAVGDCAAVLAHPRPKAGVFAVRQAPPLVENLRRAIRGHAAKSFTPQRDYLTLISLGQRRAIASRGGLVAEGAWAWHWKDWIDRRFMRQFEV